METEIISKIKDIRNIIENTIKTFDEFLYNKNYILNSLSQIEDFINQNFKSIKPSINDLKKTSIKQEIKKPEDSILKNNNQNKNLFEIKLKKTILNNNNINDINNNSNITYDNEFNSPIDYRIKYYKSKDYKGNQSINSSFDNNLNSQKYTIKSNSLNSVESSIFGNDIIKNLNEAKIIQLENSQNQSNNSFNINDINDNKFPTKIRTNIILNKNENDLKEKKENENINKKYKNYLNKSSSFNNIHNNKDENFNTNNIKEENINKYDYKLEKNDNQSNHNTESNINKKSYTQNRYSEIKKDDTKNNINNNQIGYYTGISQRNNQIDEINNNNNNSLIERSDLENEISPKNFDKKQLNNQSEINNHINEYTKYIPNRSSSQSNIFQKKININNNEFHKFNNSNEITNEDNNKSFNMSLNKENEISKSKTTNYISKYQPSKNPYSNKLELDSNNNCESNNNSKLNQS